MLFYLFLFFWLAFQCQGSGAQNHNSRKNPITNSTKLKYCWVAFWFELSHCRVSTTAESTVRTTFFSIKKQHHSWKVPLSSFYLKCHTLGFHAQTQKLEPPVVQHNKQHHRNYKVPLSSFHLNVHTLEFHTVNNLINARGFHLIASLLEGGRLSKLERGDCAILLN